MAGNALESVRVNVTSSVSRMSGTQRLTLALAFVATAAGIFAVSRLTGGTTMSMLYADLEPEAAAAVVDALEAQAVPYELANGGRAIRVPAEQVHAVRLDLSSQGLPSSGEGWSVLDGQGITTSEFDQRVGYQRAMEGELARTISAIDGVSEANVHLVIPEQDLFAGDTVQASASVLLVTEGSQPISPTQVQAIVNLVASSVEGMTPDQVSVTDQAGRLLAAPGDSAAIVGLEGDRQLRARRELEAEMENDLEELLATLVGPGLAVVNVSAELDFDTIETVTEQYEPVQTAEGEQTVLAETTRDEVYRGVADDAAEGALDAELPIIDDVLGQTPAADGVQYILDERDATYAVNKVVTSAAQAPGEVTSLSVAVLLDEDAVDAARLAEVEELVTAAAGINVDRGDVLAVSLLPINEDVRVAIEAANAPIEVPQGGLDLIGLIRTVGTVLVALVVVIFGLRMVGGGKKRKVLDSVPLAELENQMAALGPGQSGDDEDDEEEAEPRDPPEVRLQSLLANQPDELAGVLRSWLKEAEVNS